MSAEFPLSSAFSLRHGLSECGYTRCGNSMRFPLQIARYQAEPLFGVLENKILIKHVLRALSLPHVPAEYAAFISNIVGAVVCPNNGGGVRASA